MATVLDVFDDADRKIGVAERTVFHRHGWAKGFGAMRNRHVHCFILSSKRELLIQRRADAPGRDNPGMWDKSVGGHVGSGGGLQRYYSRELNELGRELNYPSLRKLSNGVWITEPAHARTYLGRYDGEVSAQRDEVEELRWVSKGVLEKMLREEEFTKDFLFLYAKHKKDMF